MFYFFAKHRQPQKETPVLNPGSNLLFAPTFFAVKKTWEQTKSLNRGLKHLQMTVSNHEHSWFRIVGCKWSTRNWEETLCPKCKSPQPLEPHFLQKKTRGEIFAGFGAPLGLGVNFLSFSPETPPSRFFREFLRFGKLFETAKNHPLRWKSGGGEGMTTAKRKNNKITRKQTTLSNDVGDELSFRWLVARQNL